MGKSSIEELDGQPKERCSLTSDNYVALQGHFFSFMYCWKLPGVHVLWEWLIYAMKYLPKFIHP